MRIPENKAIIRRYVEEIENTGDNIRIREFISENYLEVYESDRYKIGIKGAIDHVLGVRRVYPDLKITIEIKLNLRR